MLQCAPATPATGMPGQLQNTARLHLEFLNNEEGGKSLKKTEIKLKREHYSWHHKSKNNYKTLVGRTNTNKLQNLMPKIKSCLK